MDRLTALGVDVLIAVGMDFVVAVALVLTWHIANKITGPASSASPPAGEACAGGGE